MDMNVGGVLCLQQSIGGTGVHNGSSYGFAKVTLSGVGAVIVRAEEDGAGGNDFSVRLIEPPHDNTETLVRFGATEKKILVYLKKAAGAVTGTAAEVAAAINAFRKKAALRAVASTAGLMTATAELALTGGFNATLVGGQYRYTTNDATNGGLFFFNQKYAMRVFQIEGVFSAGATVTVKLVNVDNALREVSGESVTIYSAALGAANDFMLNDRNIVVTPGQAISIGCPAVQGVVRIYAARYDSLG